MCSSAAALVAQEEAGAGRRFLGAALWSPLTLQLRAALFVALAARDKDLTLFAAARGVWINLQPWVHQRRPRVI